MSNQINQITMALPELYKVTYQITQGKDVLPNQTAELNKPLEYNLTKYLKKNKRALDLSAKYTHKIINSEFTYSWAIAN